MGVPARVRGTGIAVNGEELAAGLRSPAAPVRDRSGGVVAAVNIAAPPTVSGTSVEALAPPGGAAAAHGRGDLLPAGPPAAAGPTGGTVQLPQRVPMIGTVVPRCIDITGGPGETPGDE
ncbi:IclR family transcriptional regulator C-terminal domain-containing protein [Streptomyces sp. WAC 00631]|uniref:IclR family transcriptional regulator C-terminal domain-containing protein n=2 Tax=unclassified Streptomyces TaxID=2593676 RepID=UPI001C8C3B9B|nr:IclR family transcriptional regulator C-terminal domain-containing protein [Streptomyces sp. WAC 00631]